MQYIKLSLIVSLVLCSGCAAKWEPVDPTQPLSAQEIRQQHAQNRRDAYILTAIAAVTSFFIVQSAD